MTSSHSFRQLGLATPRAAERRRIPLFGLAGESPARLIVPMAPRPKQAACSSQTSTQPPPISNARHHESHNEHGGLPRENRQGADANKQSQDQRAGVGAGRWCQRLTHRTGRQRAAGYPLKRRTGGDSELSLVASRRVVVIGETTAGRDAGFPRANWMGGRVDRPPKGPCLSPPRAGPARV